MEDQLRNYDYLALQVYWEGTKNFNSRTSIEQVFIKQFLAKYQILVLTEDQYKREDKMKRIIDLNKEIRIIKSNSFSIDEIRHTTMNSFFRDIDLITGENVNKKEETILNDLKDSLTGIAVMGMKDPEKEDELRRQDIAIKKEVLLSYTHDEKGKVRTNEEREKFLIQNELKTKQEYLEKEFRTVKAVLSKQHDMLLDMMRFMDEKLGSVNGTGTQMDGDRIMNTVLMETRKQKIEMAKLLDMTQGGKNWSEIPLTDLPRFFKLQLVVGMKKLAIGFVTFPVKGPMALINFFVVGSVKAVVDDVKSVGKIIQHVIGWSMVCMCIVNTYLIYCDPEFEEERREIYDLYATVKESIPVAIVYNPIKNTAELLWSKVPGSIFFERVLKLMSSQLQKVPGIMYEWFKSIIVYALTAMKELLTETLNTWWQEKTASLKFW